MVGTGIKTIIASGMIAAAMFGASASIANAASSQPAFTADGQARFEILKVNYRGGRRHHRRHGRRHGNGHGYGHGGHGNSYICSPRRAVNKAWNLGLNHPRVRHVGHGHIVVKGRFRGGRAKVVFARVGGCNVVSFDRRNHW